MQGAVMQSPAASEGSYAATVFALWQTLRISAPTVIEAVTGLLTVQRCDERLASWGKALVAKAEVELEISGLEHLPAGPHVVMSNHQSHFDIPILYAVYPRSLRMVAKAELFKWPIWGRAMREAGFVAVDRSGDRDKAKDAMKMVGEALERGISVWLAPEGTRSLDGSIGKLKKGGFHLAIDTGTPILPVAISGSIDIVPKHTRLIRPGARVAVSFGHPISTVGGDLEVLMGEVRAFFITHVAGAGS
jgi:1-acyl-sn-glycerol-3-phosphate acyltransferase